MSVTISERAANTSLALLLATVDTINEANQTPSARLAADVANAVYELSQGLGQPPDENLEEAARLLTAVADLEDRVTAEASGLSFTK